MLEAAVGKRIPLDELLNVYMKHQGYALCLEDFQFGSVRELLSKLPRLVRIETVCMDKAHSQVPPTTKDGESVGIILAPTDSLQSDKKSTDTQESMDDGSDNQDAREMELVTPTAQPKEVSQDAPVTAELDAPDTTARTWTVDYVCLADRAQIKHLAHKVLLVLLEAPSGTLSVAQFSERFRCTFRDEPNLNLIHEELGDIVEFKKLSTRTTDDALLGASGSARWNDATISESAVIMTPSSSTASEADTSMRTTDSLAAPSSVGTASSPDPVTNWEATTSTISLRPLIMFARELRELLRQNQGKLLLVQLCAVYQRRFGIPLRPQRYNYPSLATLLQAVDFVAVMRGRGVRNALSKLDLLFRKPMQKAYQESVQTVLGELRNSPITLGNMANDTSNCTASIFSILFNWFHFRVQSLECLNVGSCLPHYCNITEVTYILNRVLPTRSIQADKDGTYCHSSPEPLPKDAWFWVAIALATLCLSLLFCGTLLELFVWFCWKKDMYRERVFRQIVDQSACSALLSNSEPDEATSSQSSLNAAFEEDKVSPESGSGVFGFHYSEYREDFFDRRSWGLRLLQIYSVPANIILLRFESHHTGFDGSGKPLENRLQILDGFRFITMCWIVFAHGILFSLFTCTGDRTHRWMMIRTMGRLDLRFITRIPCITLQRIEKGYITACRDLNLDKKRCELDATNYEII
ncbi:unnamed protein product [Echinostoma caproni]|uniref:HTH OST-type domain-containing protein n=1 Tax=Echinostoma caproni TaxID=27848 RepID=A0A183AL58_9TREM|nr:unnamed protein product [Echinostoma caproni]